jgi:uncharacterized protein YndB with AHSA1/START domain
MAAMMTSGSTMVTVPTDTQIMITRDFKAARHLVYKVWTTPELVRRWWSGGRGEVTVAEVDLRVGGKWRYVMTADGGFEVAFHGVFREIIPNERITWTEVFEAMPDGEAVNTVTFTETDGGTTLTLVIEAASKQDRDTMINSGMEHGVRWQMEQIEKIALELA